MNSGKALDIREPEQRRHERTNLADNDTGAQKWNLIRLYESPTTADSRDGIGRCSEIGPFMLNKI